MDLTQLYADQLATFELARTNYGYLHDVIYRTIAFPGFDIRLQYNPARMLSTNAKIDATTLQARKCFLCPEYMPPQQKGIPYGDRYHIYVNPYPIFDHHFTVPANSHVPQLIGERFKDMLNLAFDFQDYTLFYNGPASGASAPDHFHFQMAPRHCMPLEKDICNEAIRQMIVQKDDHSVSVLKHYLREVIILRASDQKQLVALFDRTIAAIGQEIPHTDEPMTNLLCWFDNCQWTVCIFPRRLLRPWQFFAEGQEKVLFSPGCVDMAGLIIAPRLEDFDKYTAELLTDLFRQVSEDEHDRQRINRHLQNL